MSVPCSPLCPTCRCMSVPCSPLCPTCSYWDSFCHASSVNVPSCRLLIHQLLKQSIKLILFARKAYKFLYKGLLWFQLYHACATTFFSRKLDHVKKFFFHYTVHFYFFALHCTVKFTSMKILLILLDVLISW